MRPFSGKAAALHALQLSVESFQGITLVVLASHALEESSKLLHQQRAVGHLLHHTQPEEEVGAAIRFGQEDEILQQDGGEVTFHIEVLVRCIYDIVRPPQELTSAGVTLCLKQRLQRPLFMLQRTHQLVVGEQGGEDVAGTDSTATDERGMVYFSPLPSGNPTPAKRAGRTNAASLVA